MKAFNQLSQSAVYNEDDLSVSLTCCGGSCGGGKGLLEEISPTIVASSKMGDNQIHIVVAIHEASGKDITLSDKAYSLVSGGGQAGQGFPCVCYWNGEETAHTLTKNNAGGNQRMPDKDNFNCIIRGGVLNWKNT